MARKKIEEDSKEAVEKLQLGARILQIRRTFFDNNNREFAYQIGENEKTLSQICSGDRYGGYAIIKKILESMPEIDANWLITGSGNMTKNEQSIGDISNSNVAGVNVRGNDIHINENAYHTLIEIVDKYQESIKKHQEQLDRLITILEKKIMNNISR